MLHFLSKGNDLNFESSSKFMKHAAFREGSNRFFVVGFSFPPSFYISRSSVDDISDSGTIFFCPFSCSSDFSW